MYSYPSDEPPSFHSRSEPKPWPGHLSPWRALSTCTQVPHHIPPPPLCPPQHRWLVAFHPPLIFRWWIAGYYCALWSFSESKLKQVLQRMRWDHVAFHCLKKCLAGRYAIICHGNSWWKRRCYKCAQDRSHLRSWYLQGLLHSAIWDIIIYFLLLFPSFIYSSFAKRK